MDNNPFLNDYKKKMTDGGSNPPHPDGKRPQDPETAAPGSRRYEEKSDFVPLRTVQVVASDSPRRNRKILPIALAIVLILAIGGILIWYFNLGVRVIDLQGLSLSQAQVWAGDKKIHLQVRKVHSDEYAEDEIIDQNPAAGERLKRGDFLNLTVSLGHDLTVTLPIPDLLNMTMSQVEAWAEENYMSKVRITSEYNDKVPAGKVIRFEINDNTVVDMVRRNSPVYVIVSKGSEPETPQSVTVPDFTVMTQDQAEQFAIEHDLELIFLDAYHDFVPKGTITDQDIAPGQVIDSGSVIRLGLSLGKKIVVPNFSGYTRERAASVAAELGIPLLVNERYSRKETGKLISQSLAAGSIYQPGDFLELEFSLGNQVIVANYVGQPLSALQAWIDQYNSQGASLRISVTKTQNNAPRDTILHQDKSNVSLGTDATIRVTVSLGRKVFVPDLIAPKGSGYDSAMTRDKATAICEDLGLIVIFVEEKTEGRLPGEIWHQSVAPGSELYEGNTITLKYNPVRATLQMPDFIGKTPQEIIDEGWMKKLSITFVPAGYLVEDFAGKVFEQSLAAGRTYAYGTAVTVTVSDPAPAGETVEP